MEKGRGMGRYLSRVGNRYLFLPINKTEIDRSGVLVIGDATTTPYAGAAYENDMAIQARLIELENSTAIRTVFPPDVVTASFDGTRGYFNKDGGWAFAAQGVAKMLEKVKSLGGKVVLGKVVTELIHKEDRVAGVKCADGDEFLVDFIVIATGSWTACSFPELNLGERCLATGYFLLHSEASKSIDSPYCFYRQGLVTIQLTPEEAVQYKDVPVVLDFSSGFYSFPVRFHSFCMDF
jgi:sarcosine oxidase / L-pipecolate oxidase